MAIGNPHIEFATRSENIMTFNEAVLYCQFFEYNGHRDWRMATKQEHLDDLENLPGWFNHHTFTVDSYWSETKSVVVPVRDI